MGGVTYFESRMVNQLRAKYASESQDGKGPEIYIGGTHVINTTQYMAEIKRMNTLPTEGDYF